MKLSILLGVFAVGNFALAFLIQSWVLVIVGAGVASDAFVASLILPHLFFTVVTNQLPSVLVPMMAGTPPDELRRNAWSALGAATLTFSSLALLLAATASWWVPLIVAGVSPETKALAVRLSRIQALSILFMALHRLVDSIAHARRQFVRVELTDLFSNGAALGVLIYALPRFGIEAAAWIIVARPASSALLLLPSAGRPALPELRGAFLRTVVQRLRPVVLGSTYAKSGPLIDRFLLSWTGAGAMTLIHFAEKLYGATFDVFRRAMISPIVPRMAEHARDGDWSAYRALCLRRAAAVGAISLLALAGVAAVGLPLLKLLVGRGGLTSENVRLLWYILLLMGGYLIGGALNYVLAQALYATADTVSTAKIGAIGLTVGIPLKIAGLYSWGILGIAAATGAQQLFMLLLFAAAWRRTVSRAAAPGKTAELVP